MNPADRACALYFEVVLMPDNPFQETHFRIRQTGENRFDVLSDSERFGADQVVFESFRRGECVDYVTQCRDLGK